MNGTVIIPRLDIFNSFRLPFEYLFLNYLWVLKTPPIFLRARGKSESDKTKIPTTSAEVPSKIYSRKLVILEVLLSISFPVAATISCRHLNLRVVRKSPVPQARYFKTPVDPCERILIGAP